MNSPAKRDVGAFDGINAALGTDSASWVQRAQHWHPVLRLGVDLIALILVTLLLGVVDAGIFAFHAVHWCMGTKFPRSYTAPIRSQFWVRED